MENKTLEKLFALQGWDSEPDIIASIPLNPGRSVRMIRQGYLRRDVIRAMEAPLLPPKFKGLLHYGRHHHHDRRVERFLTRK